MTRGDMAKGMALLSMAFSREITDSLVGLYHGVLGSRLSVEQWEKSVGRALEDERFFPPPAVLLRYALPCGVPQARAVEVYLHLVDGYQSGRGMDQRDIGEKFGEAQVVRIDSVRVGRHAPGSGPGERVADGVGGFDRAIEWATWNDGHGFLPLRSPADVKRRVGYRDPSTRYRYSSTRHS